MNNWKVNDWCFCEFKLQQITEVEEGRVTSVSDGRFSLGSYDLSDRCYPLDLSIKRVSDSVAYYSDKFHKLNIPGFNYPDFNRELISRWVNLCDHVKDNDTIKKLYDELQEFCNNIERTINNQRDVSIAGFNLYR